MPSSRGSIRLSEGPVCGHTPCPECTVVKQDRTMCKCCADRIEAHGAGVGGAGPLPPLQLEEAEDAREARSNSMDPRAGPSREGRGRVRSPRRPESGGRRQAARPLNLKGEEGGKKARPEKGRPILRLEEPTGQKMRRSMVPEETPPRRGCQNCVRHTRGNFAVCCEACYKSDGRAHTEACDAWNKRSSKPPADYRRDGPEGDDDDTDPDDGGGAKGKRKGKRKGKGKGKVVVYKTYNKWARDNDRWNRWVQPGKRKKTATNVAAYEEALQMGRAESTKKSHESRLRTWDDPLVELNRRGMVTGSGEKDLLTPALVKAGVATFPRPFAVARKHDPSLRVWSLQ